MNIRVLLAAAGIAASLSAGMAQAAAPVALYHFPGGSGGSFPMGNLLRDAAGNLYGTASSGGGVGCGGVGCGMVYQLAPNGTQTIIHAFAGDASDGRYPYWGLVADSAGNLYGTTQLGGAGNCAFGCGVVYKIAPDGSETIVHSFSRDGTDGVIPTGGLTIDKYGNLYGTASGPTQEDGGVVFKIAPNGTETVLHVFGGTGDGITPSGQLAVDGAGNVYGTTQYGGVICAAGTYTCGTVFKITKTGTESVLYAFKGAYFIGLSDGDGPMGGLVRDAAGNLYGTTWLGGGQKSTCRDNQGEDGCGTVFKIDPSGTETVLHAFADGTDGAYPLGPVLLTKAGNLLGMTANGGLTSNSGGSSDFGWGVIYQIAPDGTETVLTDLGKKVGGVPHGGLISDPKGTLYGVTYDGKQAAKFGTVFRFKP
jgi:uncharacterized repeat protein (TIGR03803 family)